MIKPASPIWLVSVAFIGIMGVLASLAPPPVSGPAQSVDASVSTNAPERAVSRAIYETPARAQARIITVSH